MWRFADGNISWALQTLPGAPNQVNPSVFPAGVTDPYSITPGIISAGTDVRFNGMFPGKPIGAAGMLRDIRYPWLGEGIMENMNARIWGPTNIALYASVKQTDPATRILQPALGPNASAYALPEQLFLADHPDARYANVFGSIIMERSGQGVCEESKDKFRDIMNSRTLSMIRGDKK